MTNVMTRMYIVRTSIDMVLRFEHMLRFSFVNRDPVSWVSITVLDMQAWLYLRKCCEDHVVAKS